MGYFHLKLIAPRPTFPFDMSEAEKTAMNAHAQYWRGLAEKKLAVAVGPVFDPKGPWGMAVVETENEAEAEALGEADPVVKALLGFRYEVAPIPSLILREN
jgi:uncharacterized protein YciI